jgi:general secretion pathway protein K
MQLFFSPRTAESDERGVALLLAIFSVALLAGVVLQFDAAARKELREAGVFLDSYKAATLTRSAIQAARSILRRDRQLDFQRGVNFDALTDLWATPISNQSIGDGEVSGVVTDERGKLNVNDLAYALDGARRRDKLAQFKRLFSLLQIDPRLVDAMADWVDPDDVPENSGAESAYYMSLPEPYRAANGPIPGIRDLRLIKGFSNEIVERLSSYITVYPILSDGWININTAPRPVLQALHPDITFALATEVARARPFRTIQDVDRVGNFDLIAKELRLRNAYHVRSDYFSVRVRAEVNGVRRDAEAFIYCPHLPADALLSFRIE